MIWEGGEGGLGLGNGFIESGWEQNQEMGGRLYKTHHDNPTPPPSSSSHTVVKENTTECKSCLHLEKRKRKEKKKKKS